jgi:succinoglycan biosynthesis protein ExoW
VNEALHAIARRRLSPSLRSRLATNPEEKICSQHIVYLPYTSNKGLINVGTVLPQLDEEAHMQIGIVIPFFQRQQGLLRRAIESISNQTILQNRQAVVQLIVVDDASPVDPTNELTEFVPPKRLNVVVKKQANAGAGAARNTGLALLSERTDYVAFLDSDDVWSPDHLTRGTAALEETCADFYFCDARREGETTSLNADAPEWFYSAQSPLMSQLEIFSLSELVDRVVVNGLVPTTSAAILRTRTPLQARFPCKYFRFGEDQYFFLSFLSDRGAIVYSDRVEVECGRGVNIFAGNEPGSESERLCLMDEIAFRKDVLNTLKLSQSSRKHIVAKLEKNQIAVLSQGLWKARSGDLAWLLRTLRTQPSLALMLPAAVRSMLHIRRSGG